MISDSPNKTRALRWRENIRIQDNTWCSREAAIRRSRRCGTFLERGSPLAARIWGDRECAEEKQSSPAGGFPVPWIASLSKLNPDQSERWVKPFQITGVACDDRIACRLHTYYDMCVGDVRRTRPRKQPGDGLSLRSVQRDYFGFVELDHPPKAYLPGRVPNDWLNRVSNCGTTVIQNNVVLLPVTQEATNPNCTAANNSSTAPGADENELFRASWLQFRRLHVEHSASSFRHVRGRVDRGSAALPFAGLCHRGTHGHTSKGRVLAPDAMYAQIAGQGDGLQHVG